MSARKPRVFIGIPTHKTETEVSAIHCATQGTVSPHSSTMHKVVGLSLLARNFNELFLLALHNDFDYFVLLHSDISVAPPEGYAGSWVDYLIYIQRQIGAAAVSVVSPIKSQTGLTTTGLDLYKDNQYSLRRATVQEVQRLPRYFILRDDVCDLFGRDPEESGALLINTGCLLLDLRGHGWANANFPGFGIDDRIAWNRSGCGQAFTQSEDWRFSRWLHDKGWTYCATKDVRLNHVGPWGYLNYGTWGVPTDPTPLQPTPEDYEASP